MPCAPCTTPLVWTRRRKMNELKLRKVCRPSLTISSQKIGKMSFLRRGGRVAEGAPLLREYGAKNSIEGSNPSLSAE